MSSRKEKKLDKTKPVPDEVVSSDATEACSAIPEEVKAVFARDEFEGMPGDEMPLMEMEAEDEMPVSEEWMGMTFGSDEGIPSDEMMMLDQEGMFEEEMSGMHDFATMPGETLSDTDEMEGASGEAAYGMGDMSGMPGEDGMGSTFSPPTGNMPDEAVVARQQVELPGTWKLTLSQTSP